MSSGPKKRVRAKFHPDEDEKLRKLVGQYGERAWETVAGQMPGRNVRQCRERWKHYLSSAKLKDPWTQQEDDILFEKVQEMGAKWTKISKFLNGRTDLQAKLRWMKISGGKGRKVPNGEETIAGRFVAQKQVTVPKPDEKQDEGFNETILENLFDFNSDDEINAFMGVTNGADWEHIDFFF